MGEKLERSLLWRQGGSMDIFLPESQKSRPEEWVAPMGIRARIC